MIQFAHPQLALLFIPWAGLMAWSFWRQERAIRRLRELGESRVQLYVLGRVRFPRQRAKNMLFFLGLGFLIMAAVGPKAGTKVVELKRQGVDVLFMLDTSTSMDARDVKPSRLEKAKYEVGRLIDGLRGDRVGMIVVAGTAHLHFPLTSDYAAARLFLNAVDTRLVQVQGTVLAEGLELAMRTLDQETKKYKSLVILSDGEDHDGRALQLARKASDTGIIIHTVGIGSLAGAPIPINDNREFKKDRDGRTVTSVLNESMLEELARAGGGTHTRVDNRSGSLVGLLEEILSMEKRTLKIHEFSQFEDRYQLFALPALIFLLLELLLPGGRREAPKALSRYA
ncbi:MAG: VWA domain-containing protein [Fidelibacterota bacterium]|nr:MAG: VWA domain-containing protein [Candidatus Neomarinimicrobiota bacterium]